MTRLPGGSWSIDVLPQADPNGLFSPASADGTWVLCADPKGGKARPVLVEPRAVFSPFRLEEEKPGDPAPAG